MKIFTVVTSIIIVLGFSTFTSAQQPTPEINIAPNAPKDKPVQVRSGETQKFDEAVKPSIELAKKTYPEAKERFLKGLPPNHSFFITTKLHDAKGKFEQVFIAVKEIKNGRISGLIASDIQVVMGFKNGDPYIFPESELVDWTVTNPDGTEEGNFVGKFLDTYDPNHVVDASVWRNQPATPEHMNQRIEDAAARYQGADPIPRVVLYDVGYPRDEQEFAGLDGNAVILVTAIAQDRSELPLKRVYVSVDGKEIELKQVKLVLSEQSANKNVSVKIFGSFRADALYLLPIKFRISMGDLDVDFATNKVGFKLATLGTPVSEDVGTLAKKAPKGSGPVAGSLDTFIRREFPSFFN